MKLYTEEQIEIAMAYVHAYHESDTRLEDGEILKKLTPIELPSYEDLHPVKAVEEDGDWFVIPNELYQEFNEDTYNEELVDSGGFDDKWWKYKTGGDLNLIQLFAKTQGDNK